MAYKNIFFAMSILSVLNLSSTAYAAESKADCDAQGGAWIENSLGTRCQKRLGASEPEGKESKNESNEGVHVVQKQEEVAAEEDAVTEHTVIQGKNKNQTRNAPMSNSSQSPQSLANHNTTRSNQASGIISTEVWENDYPDKSSEFEWRYLHDDIDVPLDIEDIDPCGETLNGCGGLLNDENEMDNNFQETEIIDASRNVEHNINTSRANKK